MNYSDECGKKVKMLREISMIEVRQVLVIVKK